MNAVAERSAGTYRIAHTKLERRNVLVLNTWDGVA